MTPLSHREADPASVECWVVTVSDSRTRATDTSGDLLALGLTGAGHRVTRRALLPNDAREIDRILAEASRDESVRAILLAGGTGVSSKDLTADAVLDAIERPLPGFGELFRFLSYQEIGSAAWLSRAVAGVTSTGKVVFALPGSSAACRTALEKLILPELCHLFGQIDK
ncbi:MAG: MogA/MoaB family molybdenum cofactor biosynthesis protein [Planctomycetes bacterium]|nr:MogA/MoaB family molybdenum cofactor biosynthesis protein [Planctomycetota bacterium]